MRTALLPSLSLLSSILLATGAVSPAAAADSNWPAWRGPDATGVARDADPPTEWSETRNVRWKTAVPGLGHASPVVWGDKIFVLTAIETDKALEAVADAAATAAPAAPPNRMGIKKPTQLHQFAVLAFDRQNGKLLWRKNVCEALPHEGIHADGSFASGSPVTDGERVYASFGSRGLYCLDMDGKPVWNKDLGPLTIKMSFGEGISPALHGDALIVNQDQEGKSCVTVLERRTGKERWRADREEKTSWATPLVVASQGKTQVIISATNRIRGYDLATGTVLWECAGMTQNVIPSPVTADGIVYALSGFRGNAGVAIRLDNASGDITASEAAFAWKLDRDMPYVPSPLLYSDTLYFLRGNDAILSCVDPKTGKPGYAAQPLEGVKGVYASPVGAKDRVYVIGRNGVAVVLKRGPTFEVLATNTLNDRFSASPALAGRDLILRGHQSLYCLTQAQ